MRPDSRLTREDAAALSIGIPDLYMTGDLRTIAPATERAARRRPFDAMTCVRFRLDTTAGYASMPSTLHAFAYMTLCRASSLSGIRA